MIKTIKREGNNFIAFISRNASRISSTYDEFMSSRPNQIARYLAKGIMLKNGLRLGRLYSKGMTPDTLYDVIDCSVSNGTLGGLMSTILDGVNEHVKDFTLWIIVQEVFKKNGQFNAIEILEYSTPDLNFFLVERNSVAEVFVFFSNDRGDEILRRITQAIDDKCDASAAAAIARVCPSVIPSVKSIINPPSADEEKRVSLEKKAVDAKEALNSVEAYDKTDDQIEAIKEGSNVQ